MSKRNFTKGAFSFRSTQRVTGLGVWYVYPKGERSHMSERGNIMQTRGGCFITTLMHKGLDAFPTFEQAVDYMVKEARP